MIYIGADHRGYKLKESLVAYLEDRGYRVANEGTVSEEAADYPVISEKVAKRVKEDLNNRGILICGSGAGVCITANKINGIRAAVAWNEKVAKAIRNDDNANILCLASDEISEEEAKKISQVFLDTSFMGEERYKRRLEEIKAIEQEN
jgi:ribose 5-phosphate isomerase B